MTDLQDTVLDYAAPCDTQTYVKLLLDSSGECFYAVDRDGATTLCNAAFLRTLGFASEAQILGRKLHGLIHHHHADGSAYDVEDCPLYHCAREGVPVHVVDELFFRADNGRPVPVEYWAYPVFKDGHLQGAICTFNDVTERRRTEQELKELNETLESRVEARTRERDRIWQASRDYIVILGTDGFYRHVNPAWTQAFGVAAADVAGTRFSQFVHPDDRAMVEGHYASLLEGRTVEFEARKLKADGTYRMISWVVVPDEGELFASGRDITDQRTLEEQLRQSQKMEAIGQLTGGIAHDFNNLLTGIIGSLELLGMRLTQGRLEDAERYIVAAQGASRRAAALTHRLLAFSRRQTLDPKPVNANRLIGEMEDLVRRTLGPAIQLEVVGAMGLWTTLVDPNQLENAILNLAINARDAMPDGGRVTIETANKWLDEREAKARDLAPGQYLSVCVSDTGSGMPPEVIARAFDPFYTTKPIGQGTGLGLSMIYGFAKQSGGQVRIYSEVGQGTTVCIYLPRHAGEEEVAAQAPPAHEPHMAEQGETVLIVDDEPTVRMLVTEVLGDLGYTAIEAADGAAGLNVLQAGGRIDLLITDVGLPGGLNGRQLADAARVVRPDLKVLFITGYAENAVLGHGHLDPGMHVLTKPFAMDDLGTRVRDLITQG